jgi:hypothetical protein
MTPSKRHALRFNPRRLFGPGVVGVWFDPSDLKTMFSDSAMTTPAVVDGVVGAIMDKSGNGKHALQSGADSLKPILRKTNGLYSLDFDGTDDFLVTAAIDMTATEALTAAIALRKESDAAAGIPLEPGGNVTRTFSFRAPITAAANYSFLSLGSAGATATTGSVYAAPHSAVLVGTGKISTDHAVLRVNGVQAATSATDQGTGTYGNHAYYIGRRTGSANPFNGQVYGIIVRVDSSQLTDNQIGRLERYLARKAGVPL